MNKISELFCLSAEQWAQLAPRRSGTSLVDGACKISGAMSGMIHVLECGYRGYHCPKNYGWSTTIYNRFGRCSGAGLKTFLPFVLACILDKFIIDISFYLLCDQMHLSYLFWKAPALSELIDG